jgi:hypothetical protein
LVELSLAGCSVQQLQDNTVSIGSSLGSLYRSQVLENINAFYNDPNATPSIFSISKGMIKTSNSVTPGVTIPLGNQSTRIVAVGGVSQTVSSFNGISLQAAEAWEQSWEITPEKDPAVLQIVRAVYLSTLPE